MSDKKKKNQGDVEMQNVQEALSKSEAFIETYRKELLYGVGAVVILVLAVLAFRTYYLVPREVEAQEKMIFCVNNFERDSFRLALRGDDMNDGFETIVDDYKFTDAAELAAAYAGVCAVFVLVATQIHVPTPMGGTINLGDATILLTAYLFGPFAFFASEPSKVISFTVFPLIRLLR